MLKRVGIGVFLLFASFLLNSVIEVIGQVQMSNSTCMFDTDHVPVPLDCSWTLIPDLIGSTGSLLIFITFIEFLVAQSPWQIKGLLLSFGTAAYGVLTLVGVGLDELLINLPIRLFPGCGFFFYGIYTLVMLTIFILFVIVSKKYKLRKRDDIVPYHMFAEEYFEKNYELERQYLLHMEYEYPLYWVWVYSTYWIEETLLYRTFARINFIVHHVQQTVHAA